MNTEVTVMIVEEMDEQAGSRSGGELVELGEVSKDTQGGFWGYPDSGIAFSPW